MWRAVHPAAASYRVPATDAPANGASANGFAGGLEAEEGAAVGPARAGNYVDRQVVQWLRHECGGLRALQVSSGGRAIVGGVTVCAKYVLWYLMNTKDLGLRCRPAAKRGAGGTHHRNPMRWGMLIGYLW
jgi:hypothetical protein